MFLRFGIDSVSPSHALTHMRASTALSLHSSAGHGYSSSSVSVHASFACISGIRRPQFRYMPRSHVYRGRCSCLVRMYLVGEDIMSIGASTSSGPLKNQRILQFCEASRRHIFAVGRVYVPSAVLIRATRTRPSLPGRVSMMRPTGH